MVHTSFIDDLEKRLQEPLPGLAVLLKMAPPSRPIDFNLPDNVRKGGVLALLYPHEGKLHTVFMLRTKDGGKHSGQVSFPGGKHEKTDPDFTYTALREAEEELGIPHNEVRVLGQLSYIYINPSNFLVYPTVGYLPYRPNFVPDPTEVAAIIEADIPYLMQDDIQGIRPMPMTGNPKVKIKVPSFLVKGHVIWGATSMMLLELLTVLKEVDLK